MTPEFSHPLDVRRADGQQLTLSANVNERAALARRFGLVTLERLEAEVALTRHGEVVSAQGRVAAAFVQPCAISGEPMTLTIDEPLALRFVPATAAHRPDEELEIDAEDCDEIDYEGTSIDLGEAVAQSLALAIDPYATGPEAEAARAAHGLLGEEAAGPFAALAALKTAH